MSHRGVWALGGMLAVGLSACGGSAGAGSDAGVAPDSGSPGNDTGAGSDTGAASDSGPVGSVLATLTPLEPDAGVGTCAFLLGPPPDATLSWESIYVYIGDVVVAHDPSRTDGWDYISADYASIELFGPACDLLAAGTDGGLKVIFVCVGI